MLENNHPAMKTVVETFVIEETAELIYDNEKLDKWNEHVAALGLVGQQTIVKPEKSPIPFMHLKTNLVNVFETLCPRKVDVKTYNITPIPVEILDLVALSVRENYFNEIQIWYDEQTPDPVCVGIISSYHTVNRNYSRLKEGMTKQEAEAEKEANPEVWSVCLTNATYYLLGKWADVKQSFEELTERAAKRYMNERSVSIMDQIRYYKRQYADLQSDTAKRFGSSIDLPIPAIPPPAPQMDDLDNLPF